MPLTYARPMTANGKDSLWALTEREKQTLRLIVRGHDAKSTARQLGLSVHTINERLRDARRKMEVSSSREAARLLLEAEGAGVDRQAPDFSGDTKIGADAMPVDAEHRAAPNRVSKRGVREHLNSTGVLLMTAAIALLAFLALPQFASTPTQQPSAGSNAISNAEAVEAARRWLALVDQRRWDDSYRATGATFRKLNTLQVWADASEKVRTPLGDMVSRTFASQELMPAPPFGYEVVKFRTRFANKAEAIETVTLEREDGNWRVVGVIID
jgi:DNA-binding CsgD family transcriptional regulator